MKVPLFECYLHLRMYEQNLVRAILEDLARLDIS
jgi:hypothetical protein